jgi:hypothetical protein
MSRCWYDSWDTDVAVAADDMAGNWHSFESFAWGGKPQNRPQDCALIYLENRDSDCLEQSNAATIRAALEPWTGDMDLDGADVEIQSHNHWAVGHVDGIVIRCRNAETGEPTAAFRALHKLASDLDAYPVLDEDDFSRREQAAAEVTWRECMTSAERLTYIRNASPGEFEFSSFADMLGCARGRYFAGYASELLSQ